MQNAPLLRQRRRQMALKELKIGAAFGATLYRVLVLSCATWCDVDIEPKSCVDRKISMWGSRAKLARCPLFAIGVNP
jgi:hypothetical protein